MKSNIITLVLSLSTLTLAAQNFGFIGVQEDPTSTLSITESETSTTTEHPGTVIVYQTTGTSVFSEFISDPTFTGSLLSTETIVYSVSSTVSGSQAANTTCTSTITVDNSSTATSVTSTTTASASGSTSSAAAATLGLGVGGLMGVAALAAFL
ncbi:uncharacterized protein LY89DRAFT_726763 [Mollisia scopiformis]|uniref:Uncharacterized protein n=1 Tax=Mollisia scopiformis TaxID=149040 RepID=A0A194XU13_MOLSC|nr:uncharacterized protein LY89DRAFT_726763 [Mollisia scopiformis]KUJ23698.1 hypothetical protein LY89DRAFT_726763 [Mollisia scopiformis]